MQTSTELLNLLERIRAARVLVVGDVMLDRYWWGNASRLSPEAPVPVVALKKVSNLPGGAGNVAANIAALGAEVILVGLVGSDEQGAALRESLEIRHIGDGSLVSFDGRPTTTKTRVLVHNQQIARIDEETDLSLTEVEEMIILERVKDSIASADVVVLSDYAKGCLTRGVVSQVIDEAKRHGKIVIVDPKSRDLTKYSRATFLTPNLSEALNAAGIENGGEEMADEAAERILAETSVENLLITLGEHGMKLFRPGDRPVHFLSMARQVFDVTGAGDTVVALLAAALAAKADTHSAITFANIGAGLAVEKVGTTVVGIEELQHAIDEQARQSAS
jgi:rfaE bifunctional protein kinase chain/domain